MSPVGKPHPKDKFTPAEDEKLRILVQMLGPANWKKVSEFMGTRNPRQCRDRYKNYLAPYLNSSPWTKDDDAKLTDLVKSLGRKWSLIAKEFPGRTDINIKSRFALLKRQEEREHTKHQSEPEFLSDHFDMDQEIIAEPLEQTAVFDDGLDVFGFDGLDFDMSL